MDVSARRKSMCKCTVKKKMKVLQGRAKGAGIVRGNVASKGAIKEGEAWTEGCSTLGL